MRSQLGMRKLDKEIHGWKKNLLEHLQNVAVERALKQILRNQPAGRQDSGRSRRRWFDA
jgi:hypothetical protein